MADASLVKKFDHLDDVLRVELLERGDVIETMRLAIVAGKHHFQLGPPGVAKSYAIRALMSHIDGLGPNDFFEILLTKMTNEDMVLGPPNLAALREGRYETVVNGYLPVATFAMLDEIFKSNAAILNALLMLLNERRYRNDGAVHDSPLHTCFAASNELTEGEELDALYDRFQFRVQVSEVREPGNFLSMLRLPRVAGEKILTVDEIAKARFEASNVEVPDDVFEALNTIRQNLKASDGIEPSGRRFRDCVDIIKASAWLDGRTGALVEDTKSLINVLWTTPDEYPHVMRYLTGFANPLDREVMALLDTVNGLANEMQEVIDDPEADPAFKSKLGLELHGKVNRAKDEYVKLRSTVENSGRRSTKLDELRGRLATVIERLMAELFTLDAGNVETGLD